MGIAQELSEYFTFFVPGAQFMPSYRNKYWDGKVRLYNTITQHLYAGLMPYVELFASERGYEVEYDFDYCSDNFSLIEAEEFLSKQKFTLTPKDYQIKAFVDAIRGKRHVFVSPTASGKSFIIYMIMRYYLSPTLIIVPTTSLIHQMYSDFESYGFNSDKYIHKIFSGQDKDIDKPIIISTWQSIYKLPIEWFKKFDVVFGDEAHLFKAQSLTKIMTKLTDCRYRFGFTGTLDGTKTHKLILEGLFGSVKQVTTTKILMDEKHLADFKIKILVLTYDEPSKKIVSKMNYQDEMGFIVSNDKRNQFIKNLVLSLKGNTLLLFQYVENHGKILYDMIKSHASGRKVFFVHGGVDGIVREEIRQVVEGEENAIIVASYGTFSTGINIKNLFNVVFASPSKSRIRNLQSIGRSLRRSDQKTSATLYDIADDLRWKSRKNYTLEHLEERIKIYDGEEFRYKIYNVRI
jgi:superfamily II DNA or RNA helicase